MTLCYLCAATPHLAVCPRADAGPRDSLHDAVRDYLALMDSGLTGLSTIAAVEAIDAARERMRRCL